MRGKTRLALLISAVLALAFAFSVFASGIPGEAVSNGAQSNSVTREDALAAINESMAIMQELKENNFSIYFLNDSIIQANERVQLVDYALILKSSNVNSAQKTEARNALQFIDWKNFSYADVLIYTQSARDRRAWAYILSDSLTITEIDIKSYKSRGLNVSDEELMFADAKEAFYFDRYSEAETMIKEIRDSLRQKDNFFSIVQLYGRGLFNFLKTHWWQTLIVLIVLYILAAFFYKRIRIVLLENKIESMKKESVALIRLMKEAQKERFNDKTMPDSVYHIRMRDYKNRGSELDNILPVHETRLRRLRYSNFLTLR